MGLREAAKKITVFFLVARPLRGGLSKGLATKEKIPLFFAASLTPFPLLGGRNASAVILF